MSTTFSNTTTVSIPSPGATSSSITVSSPSSIVTGVTLTLNGLSHFFPDDVDLLLVGPDGTHNLKFLSDAGGSAHVGNAMLTFDDRATAELADDGPIVSGTYRPTDFDASEIGDDFGVRAACQLVSRWCHLRERVWRDQSEWRLEIVRRITS